jgi:16S rRNA processing protein RimM
LQANHFLKTAVLGQPFGLEGFIKIHSLSGEFSHILKLKTVKINGKFGEKNLEIEKCEQHGSNLQIKFRGIDNLDDAKQLSGSDLFVERDEAAELFENEYYIEDLKGIAVKDIAGQNKGQVNDVIEGGNGQLVEIELTDGSFRFVPFRNEFFGTLSLEKREIILLVDWILE